ncbi:YkgJ family cysteine cluster protein [Thiovibrio frasassiensis]|uniref:YkgJ family cysteine cluster protein n=1 Tax=Thiovibrio frasassiensis TaxID=2984131 RepID=A0A9X4MGL0_9BACT|nr:YkgJ family cysteine cluster protein [Thiovibrio frasassiensis]MDG4476866.1 YkgJ family cysteine cluster protein [Thiovibrio frasassiensis]
MQDDLAPEHVHPLNPDETFRFSCHPGVACFTDCCRQLDLALTPYDVLRLSSHLGLTPSVFLHQYALVEQEEGNAFPLVFLGMVDDGRASCPFVTGSGCSVYADRPAACRTYPLGRGAFTTPDGDHHEMHVLLNEPHCKGFNEGEPQNIAAWQKDQELAIYNGINDELLRILHHPRLKDGHQPEAREIDIFLALYTLDTFRNLLLDGNISLPFSITENELQEIAIQDLALLRLGIRWLDHVLSEH